MYTQFNLNKNATLHNSQGVYKQKENSGHLYQIIQKSFQRR